MTEEFAGKVAIVTGGGSGIGAAICRALAAHGAEVIVADLNEAAARAVAAAIDSAGGRASGHVLDVADGAAFRRLAEAAAQKAAGIDILVNCAGMSIRRLLPAMQREDWDRVIAVNLTGALNGIQAVLPYLKARGE